MELHSITDDSLLEDQEEERSSWEPPVRNLDKFFSSMYHYHNSKGLPTVLITQLCAVISLGFTATFSTFLLGFVDWAALKNCHDESSCGTVSNYIASNPFQQFSFLRNLFILIYFLMLIAFWIWRSYHSLAIVRRATQMEKFYREKLGVRVADLHTITWDEIVQRLIHLHDRGVHRVAIKDKLTEIDIVLRVMRKDNYLIGLINKNILDLRVPWWIVPFISERLFLTKSLEWSLSFCIMEYIFNDQFNVSALFLKDIAGLQGRFVMVGLINLALLPFMIIFMSISFFLQNAQSFHSNKAYLGPRQWSPLALWTFREFNELPHVFESRINKSVGPANEYVGLFHNINTAIVARSTAYIAGSFIATLLLLSFLAEGVFLYVNIADHNCLWWLGIFSAVYAGSRSMIPDETKQSASPLELMKQITSNIHYCPDHWLTHAHSWQVRDELAELFPFKAKVFAMEVLSVVLTPIVLCFSLPKCAPAIIEFVRDHSRYVEGVGAVCDYSLFDFDQYGDEQFGAAASGYMDKSQRPARGKMEQSYLNFQQAHPRWEGTGPGGRAFMERIGAYKAVREMEKEEQMSELLRESFYPSVQFPNAANPNNLYQRQQQGVGQKMQNRCPVDPSNETDPERVGPASMPSREDYATNSLNQNPVNLSTNINISGAVPVSTKPISTGTVGLVNGTWNSQGYVVNHGATAGCSENHSMPEQHHRNQTDFNFSQQNQYLGMNQSPPSRMNDFHGNNIMFSSQHPRGSVPSLLKSILNQENIDYQNDFYWLNRFHYEHTRNPQQLEQSIQGSINSLGQFNLMNKSRHSLVWNHQSIVGGPSQEPSMLDRRRFAGSTTGPYPVNRSPSNHSDFDFDLSLNALGEQQSFNSSRETDQINLQPSPPFSYNAASGAIYNHTNTYANQSNNSQGRKQPSTGYITPMFSSQPAHIRAINSIRSFGRSPRIISPGLSIPALSRSKSEPASSMSAHMDHENISAHLEADDDDTKPLLSTGQQKINDNNLSGSEQQQEHLLQQRKQCIDGTIESGSEKASL